MPFIQVEGVCIEKKDKNINIGKKIKLNFDSVFIIKKNINRDIKDSTYE